MKFRDQKTTITNKIWTVPHIFDSFLTSKTSLLEQSLIYFNPSSLKGWIKGESVPRSHHHTQTHKTLTHTHTHTNNHTCLI